LNRSIKGEDIVKFIKVQRRRLLGHVKRMEVGAMPRKMTEGRLFVGRRKGRVRLRWMDDVADLKVMKIKQWMKKTKDREQWRLLRRSRLTQGCSTERMDRGPYSCGRAVGETGKYDENGSPFGNFANTPNIYIYYT
jgi:hypothetical protein